MGMLWTAGPWAFASLVWSLASFQSMRLQRAIGASFALHSSNALSRHGRRAPRFSGSTTAVARSAQGSSRYATGCCRFSPCIEQTLRLPRLLRGYWGVLKEG